jgi:hypothetical protein
VKGFILLFLKTREQNISQIFYCCLNAPGCKTLVVPALGAVCALAQNPEGAKP